MYHQWKPYVPVAQRRANALRKISKLKAKGDSVAPVEIRGRQIAHTFWGKAWCDNLENYSDFENRLPRGRTYVRNGSVIDLQVSAGKVEALVSGSDIYKVTISVPRMPSREWVSICEDCGSSVKSLVELLQGRLSDGVMERVCRPKTGLFPAPSRIDFKCTCPDWAWMCKHVAAVLYGVGARLDKQPDLLFKLRDVDVQELVASADGGIALDANAPVAGRLLERDDLSELFGLELAEPVEPQERPKGRRKVRTKPATAPRRTPKKQRKRAQKTTAKAGAKARAKKLAGAKPPGMRKRTGKQRNR